MRRTILGIVLFAALLATVGCMTITVDSSVSADGTVESYEVTMTINNSFYPTMEAQAQSAGYDSFGAFFLAENASVDQSNAESVDISEEKGPENTTVTIKMENYDPGPDSNISVRVEDGTVVYEDVTFGPKSESTPTPTSQGMNMNMGGGSIEYRLEMPGEIQDASTGATVDGNVATWTLEGDGDLYIYAESSAPEQTTQGDSGGDDGDGGDGSSGFGPGFGVGGVLVALIVVTLALRRRAGN